MAYNTPQNPTILPIAQSAIPATVTTVYTVPVKSRTWISTIDIVNTNSTATTFDVYFVPQSGTAGTGNAVFYQQTLQPKQNLQWTGIQVIDSLSTIQVNGSATGVTIRISGETYAYY
jgi:hypothetical protein